MCLNISIVIQYLIVKQRLNSVALCGSPDLLCVTEKGFENLLKHYKSTEYRHRLPITDYRLPINCQLPHQPIINHLSFFREGPVTGFLEDDKFFRSRYDIIR
jgi:hypothetical protein